MGTELRLRGNAGEFILTNGSRLPTGPFRIEQTNSGRTFLYCERTLPIAFSAAFGGLLRASFEGQTTAGQTVRTGCGLNSYVDGPKQFCLILQNVEIGHVGASGHTHSLSLTNLRFPSDSPKAISFTVSWGDVKVALRISPRRNYTERIRQLAKTEDVVPTATVRFHAPAISSNVIGDFITDLCLALSVVQGKKINWIYHATYGPRRAFQHAVFGETVCKADTAQPLCFNPKMRTGETPGLTASTDALPRVKRFREAYDPKRPTDQQKAVWKGLHKKMTEALPGESLLPTLESWQRLNEKSFRDILANVCEHHGLRVQPNDLTLFKSIRDNIVHRFSYDPAIRLPSEWSIPNQHQVSQHFFAAWFVDQIILQLFGLIAPFAPAPM